jgi:hypothetical protein
VTDQFGPPPFRFELAGGPLSGPAFSPVFKVLVTAVVFGSAAWFVVLWSRGAMPGVTWFLAALAMMLYTWWCIVRSITRLEPDALHQTWIWDKKMELRELAYGKLIRVPGLDWLIAPRLYVRTLLGKFAVFYAADAQMIREFERLIAELKTFRDFR